MKTISEAIESFVLDIVVGAAATLVVLVAVIVIVGAP